MNQRTLILIALAVALIVAVWVRETRWHPEEVFPDPATLAQLESWGPERPDLDALARQSDLREPPTQIDLPAGGAPALRKLSYRIEPRAAYVAEGRVLSRRRYRLDSVAGLAPFDVAMGWGRMTEDEVLDELRIRQARRWYRYRWKGTPPIPAAEIQASSSNKHLIPASRDIYREMQRMRDDDRVRITGYLVNVTGDDGMRWNTSMRRDDSGDGACEIILVTRLDRLTTQW